MITCPNCGQENPEGESICTRCGTPLVDMQQQQSTRALGDTDFEEGTPKWGSARFGRELVVEVLDTGQSFVFDSESFQEVTMGRQDPNTGEAPEVDLTASEGLDKGVSRRHATIMRRDGALHIVDNASANGTFLNGQRLVSQQPRILRDGDDIRLGHLVLRVTFRR